MVERGFDTLTIYLSKPVDGVLPSRLIHNPSAVLAAADAVGGVEAGERETDCYTGGR